MASTINIIPGLLKFFITRFVKNNDPELQEQQLAFEQFESPYYDYSLVVQTTSGITWRPKRRLIASTIFFVNSTSGSDEYAANRGTNANVPFKTIAAAISFIYYFVDPCGFPIRIKLADGVYPGCRIAFFPGSLTIEGNAANPSAVKISFAPISATVNAGFYIQRSLVTINGVSFDPFDSGAVAAYSLFCGNNSTVSIRNIVFNDLLGTNRSRYFVYSHTSSFTSLQDGITIAGSTYAAFTSYLAATLIVYNLITILNSPAFTYFVFSIYTGLTNVDVAQTGATTGTKALVQDGGFLMGANNLPATMNPVVNNGGTVRNT